MEFSLYGLESKANAYIGRLMDEQGELYPEQITVSQCISCFLEANSGADLELAFWLVAPDG